MAITRISPDLPEFVENINLIKSIDIIYCQNTFIGRSIKPRKDPIPAWLSNYAAEGTPAQWMDCIFDLIMMNNRLTRDIDSRAHYPNYLDVILTSRLDQKAVIKGASIESFNELDLTIIGGLFVFADTRDKLNKSRFSNLEFDD